MQVAHPKEKMQRDRSVRVISPEAVIRMKRMIFRRIKRDTSPFFKDRAIESSHTRAFRTMFVPIHATLVT